MPTYTSNLLALMILVNSCQRCAFVFSFRHSRPRRVQRNERTVYANGRRISNSVFRDGSSFFCQRQELLHSSVASQGSVSNFYVYKCALPILIIITLVELFANEKWWNPRFSSSTNFLPAIVLYYNTSISLGCCVYGV